MSDYYKLLKDPRWQKKRLQILDDADWKCEECGDKEETLHAHHRYYENNKAPWDYPHDAFQCLCDSCHTQIHFVMNELRIQQRRHNKGGYKFMLGYAIALNQWRYSDIDFHPNDGEIMRGFADYYEIDIDSLERFLSKHGRITQKQAKKLSSCV